MQFMFNSTNAYIHISVSPPLSLCSKYMDLITYIMYIFQALIQGFVREGCLKILKILKIFKIESARLA